MPRLSPLLLTSHFRRLGDLLNDLANQHPDDWPQVIFIEPDYYDCPVHLHEPCDNHPPLAIKSVSSVLSVGAGNIEPCEVSAALTLPTAKAPPHPTVTSNLRQGFYQAVKNLAGKHGQRRSRNIRSFAPIQNPKLIQNPKEDAQR